MNKLARALGVLFCEGCNKEIPPDKYDWNNYKEGRVITHWYSNWYTISYYPKDLDEDEHIALIRSDNGNDEEKEQHNLLP